VGGGIPGIFAKRPIAVKMGSFPKLIGKPTSLHPPFCDVVAFKPEARSGHARAEIALVRVLDLVGSDEER